MLFRSGSREPFRRPWRLLWRRNGSLEPVYEPWVAEGGSGPSSTPEGVKRMTMGCGTVDLELVWDVAQSEVPKLKAEVAKILRQA